MPSLDVATVVPGLRSGPISEESANAMRGFFALTGRAQNDSDEVAVRGATTEILILRVRMTTAEIGVAGGVTRTTAHGTVD